MMRWLFGLVLLAAACVPATPPPQLEWTPGDPVVVTDRRVTAVDFSAAYPDGWRVITGSATVPPSVMFVAPDDRALILLSRAPIDDPPQLELEDETPIITESRRVELDNGVVYAVLVAPEDEQWLAAFMETLLTVRNTSQLQP